MDSTSWTFSTYLYGCAIRNQEERNVAAVKRKSISTLQYQTKELNPECVLREAAKKVNF